MNMDLSFALAVTTAPIIMKRFPINIANRLPNLSGRYEAGIAPVRDPIVYIPKTMLKQSCKSRR